VIKVQFVIIDRVALLVMVWSCFAQVSARRHVAAFTAAVFECLCSVQLLNGAVVSFLLNFTASHSPAFELCPVDLGV